MSDFGDATEEDSFDPTAPPDPVASARILLLIFQLVTGDSSRPEYDDLTPEEQAMWAFGMLRFLARLRREGGL